MSWRDFLGRPEPRAQSLGTATQRDLRLVEWFDGGGQTFGQTVNTLKLEWLSASTASIDAISGTLASLPSYVYAVTATGRVEDESHPLFALIRDGANRNQTWPDYVQWLVAETLRHGNSLSEIILDGSALSELRPIPWERVAPRILASGRLVYDFTDPVTLQRRRLLDTEVLHVRDRSDDGLIGRARHERAHPVIAAALALTEFSGNSYKNGAYPSGTLSLDGKLNQIQMDSLRRQFKELFTTPAQAAKALILEQGVKWDSVTATPEDMELLAARRFAIEEAARLYQVPPPIIGDLSHGTFTNSETLIRFFAQSTISIWCRKIEAEIMRSLFSSTGRRTHEFCFDLSGLLRGDPAQRWASYKIAVDARILTPNEIRDEEGWNPRPGGDGFPPVGAPQAMVPA